MRTETFVKRRAEGYIETYHQPIEWPASAPLVTAVKIADSGPAVFTKTSKTLVLFDTVLFSACFGLRTLRGAVGQTQASKGGGGHFLRAATAAPRIVGGSFRVAMRQRRASTRAFLFCLSRSLTNLRIWVAIASGVLPSRLLSA